MSRWLLLVVALELSSCRSTSRAPPPSAREGAPAEAASSVDSAHAALDRLDSRTPLPLLPMMAHHQKQNMQDHLIAVQDIVTGLGKEDFDGVARAAERLGSSPQMTQMCSHLGAGAPGFTERALAFHRTADEIGVAAQARDEAGVLAALGKTLSACTGCHATFKQQLVAELD